MALNPKRASASIDAEAAAVTALLNNGYLRVYDGAQPANANAAVTTQVLLAELRWNGTAFGAPSAGVATAAAITADSSANNTGTAAWFRALKSDGTTGVFDGSVGTGTNDIVLNTASIVAAAAVAVAAFTYTANPG